MLWPREHGAYAQLLTPIICALAVAGPSTAGVAAAAAAVCLFLAHEPLAILLGRRGQRSAELNVAASRAQLFLFLAGAGIAALSFLYFSDSHIRASGILPAAGGLVLALSTLLGVERSAFGLLTLATATASLALPIAVAGGLPWSPAVALAALLAGLAITQTLAVRTVLAATGRRAISPHTRALAALWLVGAALLGSFACVQGWFPWTAGAVLAAPILGSSAIVARPPHPRLLPKLGWFFAATNGLALPLLWLAFS